MIYVKWDSSYMAYLVWNYEERDGIRFYQDANGDSKKVKPNEEAPFWLMLAPDEATNLADQLHVAGVRPNRTSFMEGELAATKKHLEDMRQIAMLTPPSTLNAYKGTK